MKKIITTSALLLIAFIIGAIVKTTYAGSLTPPGVPASTMYTLGDIYTKLTDSTTTTTEGSASFTTPGSVSATFHNLKQIYELIPTIDATKVLTGTTYLGVAGTASGGSSSLPLKTGQTHCNAFSGGYGSVSQVPCAGTNQDGDLKRGVTRSYTDNADGTVTDNATGLMWQKCSDGQTGLDCSGGAAVAELMDDGYGVSPAINYCEGLSLASHTDWHLPSVNELQSLVDYGRVNTSIDPSFPLTQSAYYWSSTAYEGNASFAWVVNFYAGGVDYDGMDNSRFVRCVRG